MPLLRLAILLLYPASIVLLLLKRRRELAEAARRAGTRIEAVVGARSPRSGRVLLFAAGALLLTCAGRLGAAAAVVFALVTAPLAAASLVRFLAVTGSGLLLDSSFTPWSELSGWIAEPAAQRLLVLRRAPGLSPIELRLNPRELKLAASALSRHLPSIEPPTAR
jgi:hypothetical protein